MKHTLGILCLMAACFAPATRGGQVVILPIDDTTGIADFNTRRALAVFADSLDDGLGRYHSLAPQHQVEQLCREFWRLEDNWDLSRDQAIEECSRAMQADYVIGLRIVQFRFEEYVDDIDKDACTGRCERRADPAVDPWGRIIPGRFIYYDVCSYRRTSYSEYDALIEARMEVELFVYDVRTLTKLLTRHKRFGKKRDYRWAESSRSPNELRDCPRGPMENTGEVTRALPIDLFHNPGHMPNADELLANQWRLFSRESAQTLAETFNRRR